MASRPACPTLWLYSRRTTSIGGLTISRALAQGLHGSRWPGEFVSSCHDYKSDGHPSFTGKPEAWSTGLRGVPQDRAAQIRSTARQAGATAGARSDTPEAYHTRACGLGRKAQGQKAVIIVRREGRVVHQAAIGGADPVAPVLLASLSKAITGACIATLVRDGSSASTGRCSRALAKFFKANGHPADARIERTTIAHLLAHRAGFSSAVDGEDESTGTVLKTYLESHSPRDAPAPIYLSMVFEKGLQREPGQRSPTPTPTIWRSVLSSKRQPAKVTKTIAARPF